MQKKAEEGQNAKRALEREKLRQLGKAPRRQE
jgi:hypothetical protein